MSYDEELDVAEQAAQRAGTVMQEYQESSDFTVSRKSAYNDLVTEADFACQEQIIETIQDAFPEDGFLAEENDQRPDGEDRVWVIDPIDGTTNFTHGFPQYCTSIALKVDGTVQVGVVYAPVQDELFTAVSGGGAQLNGEQISVSDIDQLKDALVITRLSDWNNEPVVERENAFLRELLAHPSTFRRPGCAALDLCYVACGRADGHALVTINEWDVAAAGLIVEEAGGTFHCQDAIIDGYLGTVSSNGRIQDELEHLFDKKVYP